MLSDKKIFFIGAGNMGGAILCALTDSGYPPELIFFYEPNEEQAHKVFEKSKAIRLAFLSDGFLKADVVFLCIKPQIFSKIRRELIEGLMDLDRHPIVISVMAGVPVSALKTPLLTRYNFVRTMPNIAVTVKKGTVAIATDNVEESVLQLVEFLFSKCANTVRVHENQMDAVTGLSGSGPAFIFQFIEALAMGGVKMGLQRDVAMKLALSTMIGSVKMLENSSSGPSELTADVCSPAGTTIAGLQALENRAFKGAVMAAVETAAKRSAELGKAK